MNLTEKDKQIASEAISVYESHHDEDALAAFIKGVVANNPVKKQLVEALKLAQGVAPGCNPQDPELIYSGEERCPPDHPNCCGYCEAFHAVTAALRAVEEEGK